MCIINCSSISWHNNVTRFLHTKNQQSPTWSLILWHYQGWYIIISGQDLSCVDHTLLKAEVAWVFRIGDMNAVEVPTSPSPHQVTQSPTGKFPDLQKSISGPSVESPLLFAVQVACLSAWWWPSWHGSHTSLHPQTVRRWMLPQILE